MKTMASAAALAVALGHARYTLWRIAALRSVPPAPGSPAAGSAAENERMTLTWIGCSV
jgi:hypothetical protein